MEVIETEDESIHGMLTDDATLTVYFAEQKQEGNGCRRSIKNFNARRRGTPLAVKDLVRAVQSPLALSENSSHISLMTK